ncbi:hypothetical protein PRK78_005713 [Emydomyces testavorans]|uniref:Fe2OG dioxygenase domain-containing protein n=1 Tax=Emydomyces testavorans TaxID=2070801 RepID=A0AAF0DKR8_9EURO|nr:hypothetical protein PRK78_005713 [Emydomyces testavorans]
MLPADFFGQIPTITTRRALLILDLQTDFVSPDGALFVPNTPDFIHRIPVLAAHFRSSGKVIWVQTVFQHSREPFSPESGGDIILVNPPTHPQSSKSTSSSSSIDPEAFLAVQSPDQRRCCLENTPGAQFPPPILSAIDHDADTILVKSGYSAFQSPHILLSFRTQFITQVYICGALSNVSVYATVLDAVRNGFSVTLIEDCLGFRRFARHREAVKRMTDVLGVETMSSEQILQGEQIEQSKGPSSAAEVHHTSSHAPIEVDNTGTHDEELKARLLSRAQRWRRRTSTQQEIDLSGKPQEPVNGTSTDTPSIRPSGRKETTPTCGPGDHIGSGDSSIIYNLLLPDNAFQLLRQEVNWQKMYHMSGQVPRLVAVQGAVQSDGSIPIYRHPADESPPLLPFTDTVDRIREMVEKYLGHPLNHVLIQLYRSGDDRISEHSDKTLDIVRGSSICNVSLGAQRVMTLRTKASAKSDAGGGRQSQRVPMPHRSLFILGETTNMQWLHGIRPDKRPATTKSPEELAFNGERISLTFRHIGTFIHPESDTIWGQGACSKSKESASQIIHGESSETQRLIRAFGQENHQTQFDWNAHYGAGFDVVNFVTTSSAKIVLTGNEVFDLRVLLGLVENGIRYELLRSKNDLPPSALDMTRTSSHGESVPIYLDADGTTCVSGDTDILSHISTHHRAQDTPDPIIPIYSFSLQDRLAAADILLATWHRLMQLPLSSLSDPLNSLDCLAPQLDFFASLLPPGRAYIAAPTAFGIDDCVFWPVLRCIMLDANGKIFVDKQYPTLAGYYYKVARRACVKGVLEEMKLHA